MTIEQLMAPATAPTTAPAPEYRTVDLVRVRATATRRRRIPRWAGRLAGPLALVSLWAAGSASGLIPADILASPVTVLTTGGHLLATGELEAAMAASLRRVLIGLAIGVTVGVALALVSGLLRIGEDLIDPNMQILRTVPFFGLIPLLIIWFGIDEAPKVALVALGVTFHLYLNLYAGVRNVDAGLVEAGRTLGMSRGALVRHVVLPGALPNLMTGLRYALATAWLALVFAEQINARTGIGYLMNNARDFFQTDVIVVCLAVYGLLGLGADLLVRLLERVLLAWRPTFSGA
jgi:sulfonate transport system permease protein